MSFLIGLALFLSTDGQHTVVALRVNQIDRGDAVVLLSPSDIWIPVRALVDAKLQGFEGERVVLEGQEYISLASLAPSVTYTLDERELRLEIVAGPDLLDRTIVHVRTHAPHDVEHVRNTSIFLNYAATMHRGKRPGIDGEAGVGVGPALLLSTFSYSAGGFRRGLTSLTIDERARLRRWTVGDVRPVSFTAVGGLPHTGISVSRNFSLNPYYTRFPDVGLTAPVETASTLEVYINEHLVHRQQVSPGHLDVRSLPIVQGSGMARLLLRDAFGREQEVSSKYYFASRNLARGTSEYSYSLGFAAPSFPRERSLGRLALLGSHRHGVNDALTTGFHVGALRRTVAGGSTVAVSLARGELELSLTGGTSNGRAGAAAWLSYRYQTPRVGVGTLLRVRSVDAPAFALNRSRTDPVRDATLFVNLPLCTRVTMSLQYHALRQRGTSWRHELTPLATLRIASRVNLVSSAILPVGRRGPHGVQVFAGLHYLTGRRTIAGATTRLAAQGVSSQLQWTRSLPEGGRGFGYRLESDRASLKRTSALLQYQTPFGRYELTHAGDGSGSLVASGSVVALGGRLYVAQPVQQAFGLVRLPGVAGARGYVNNTEVGRTNARGDLFIANLLPYYANRITIAPEALPIDAQIGATEKLVAPPYRAGVVIAFPVTRVQAVTGRIAIDVQGQRMSPGSGDLVVVVNGTRVISPLGLDGQFYFESLPPGRHEARTEGADLICRAVLSVPASDEAFVTLGTVLCDP